MTSALLAVTMLVSALPSGVSGADETEQEDYELRVLTFEDAGGDDYWSSLIAEDQYSDPLLYGGATKESEAYKWHDAGYTELAHTIPYNYGGYNYWGGGHAISNYVSTDFEAYGDYMSQLTVFSDKEYQEGVLERTGGGNNGSDNFAVHFGYKDGSEFNGTENLPALYFADGKARVIDHMYVNSTTYFLNCALFGDAFSRPLEEDDWVKIVAIGYNGEEITGESEFYLADGFDLLVAEWTLWDMSELGEVTKVEFNFESSVAGDYGMSLPGYFAYDDVAVRFEKAPGSNKVSDIYVEESEAEDTYDYYYFTDIPESESGKAIIALYCGEKLVGVDIKDIANGENDVWGSTAVSEAPDRFRIMLWDGVDSMEPLCKAVEGDIE